MDRIVALMSDILKLRDIFQVGSQRFHNRRVLGVSCFINRWSPEFLFWYSATNMYFENNLFVTVLGSNSMDVRFSSRFGSVNDPRSLWW
tara:strand:- start:63 stop:329 length:267 start_codon:yes stop_codon:yes gene_type:complete